MTYLFTNIRFSVYLVMGILSATVLGLAAYFATLFLPNIHHDYTLFALIVPSVTIFFLLMFLMLTHSAQPRFEAVGLFILATLWLALASWTVDRRDFLSPDDDCSSWGIQRTITKSGTMSAMAYCQEMKIVEAFSWITFGTFVIALITVIMLTSNAYHLGRPYAWREPMLELGWFGEFPGYSGGPYSSYPTFHHQGMMQPGMMMQPGYAQTIPQQYGPGGGYVVQQTPGHSVIIQPGVHGDAPTITQVPGMVSGV